MDDKDVWSLIDPEDLWIYDKLILSRKLGYDCGPAGVAPTVSDTYVVRPISNYRMMSAGAHLMYIEANQDLVPHGYFWCEQFSGRHLTFDYCYGEQSLAVEGFRNSDRLDRFSKWAKVKDTYAIPECLQEISKKYKWLNLEVVDGNVIEVHLRQNDDFKDHSADVIYPVWKNSFMRSECGDRVGFILERAKDEMF